MIDIKTAETEDLLKVVDVATEFEHARQQAYSKAKVDSEFQPWFERAEALYQDFCAAYGLKPKPVFDSEQHIRLRIAQGHPDFLHYHDRPEFADVVPYSLPREGW
ncbi:hypothetical protein HOU02_gp289 [Caulobacter phage CcrBL9]|uniref:Uncharacterized protein n=1 Tax=Caulobacter phage CcrBL9 TaxID=2283270 RepID=A0A385ECM6_9CAUD|nr:hypothetical protein HOU02_gp289 [Caulobacter phage CcrBL9]AXQ69436.1 hypothetical protein CcrBL9_gp412 [Caulobacter phage CcrBL9]